MNNPRLVSIVLPTFNGSRYIVSAIESILAQTYNNFELIVVDGGSTDNTLELVRGLNDSRIHILHQPANSGRLPGALNLGFAEAQGEFYTWAQDDDLYAPDALEVLVNELSIHPEVGLVYTGMWRIDGVGKLINVYDPEPPDMMYQRNVVGHCFLYRRSIAEQVGLYDLNSVMAEDFEYWARIFVRASLLAVPGQHYYHRLHSNNLTGQPYGAYESLRVTAHARRKSLGISWLAYQRQLAAADIEEGFAAHGFGDAQHAAKFMLNGLIRDPLWIFNRGVVIITVRGLLNPKSKI